MCQEKVDGSDVAMVVMIACYERRNTIFFTILPYGTVILFMLS